MSGIFADGTRWTIRASVAIVVCVAALGRSGDASPPPARVSVTRAEMLAIATRMADHKWTCRAENLTAMCLTKYRSRWVKDQKVVGVAYDWGGMDAPEAFEAKLKAANAAGSHKEEGVSPCTAGVDCSGFLSLCWRQTTKFGTATIGQIAPTLQNINIQTDLKVGDALNRSGAHIVMFAGYNPDGTINVYEAAGLPSRVVLTKGASWARFKRYVPIRYQGTVD
jgi:hypothetical protein